MKVFIDFTLIHLKIKCYSILQKRLSRMLDISNCDVIYYAIYGIWSHYVGKAISPLFAWPSSFVYSPLKPFNRIQRNLTGSKISTSSSKCVIVRSIGKPRWPPCPILQPAIVLGCTICGSLRPLFLALLVKDQSSLCDTLSSVVRPYVRKQYLVPLSPL